MATYKTGWLRLPSDAENFKGRFAWSHVKSIFYDKAKNILLKKKLDDMDSLISDHADAIANKLMTNDAFNTAIADYVTKAMMSSTQVNDANHVPTSSLAYAMQQAITANANAITQLNSETTSINNTVTNQRLIRNLSEINDNAGFQVRTTDHTYNVNYLLSNGIYATPKTSLNLPFDGYWILLVFNASKGESNNSGAWIFQIAVCTDTNNKALFFRRNINYKESGWETWRTISAT